MLKETQNTSGKILVTYASRGGSTAGVAEMIGKTLAEHGIEVDVLPMAQVGDVSGYRAVIAGSAIRRERWLPEAMQFMQRHQDALCRKPLAVFLVCMALAVQDEKRREKAVRSASAWLQPVRTLVQPVSEGLFAGVLDLSKIPEIGYRTAFRVAISLGFWAEGDYRNWDEIRRWAGTLPAKLVTSPS